MSPMLVSVLLSVYPIHPGLSDVHSAAVTPVMTRAKAEVEAVVGPLKQHKLVTTAAYGSWFLPVVAVGGDLDFLGVVDIGDLPASGAGEAAVQRIEALLIGLGQRMGRADPSLTLLQVEGLDGDFKLTRRARAIELIEAAAKGPSNVAYPLKGRQVPYYFPPGVVSLPLHPRAKYLSNAFGLDPAKQANVREVSVQFFFVARANGKPLILQPLYGRAAAPIELWRFVLETAFASADDRARFSAIARPGFDDTARRAEYGAFMLMVADQEIGGKRAVKAVKRLAQAFLAIEPAIDAQTKRDFVRQAAQWLVGPSAIYDDLKAVAKIHAKAVKAGVEASFRQSGDVRRVVDGYISRLGKLKDGELQKLLMKVHSDPKAWAAVASAAKAKSKSTAPDMGKVRDWSRRLHSIYDAAGVRMVPVHGLEGDAVVIRRADLEGVSQASLPRWPIAPWRIEVREVPGADPVRRLFVQLRTAGGKRLQDALKATPLRW